MIVSQNRAPPREPPPSGFLPPLTTALHSCYNKTVKSKTFDVGPAGNSLTLYNTGHSRSRIVLATAGDTPAAPRLIRGTRWLVFGDHAAERLAALIRQHSWPQLANLIPGGFTSSLWQKLRHEWQLDPPQVATLDALHFLSFGEANSRVLLLRAGAGLLPERIGDTSIIALSPRARIAFARFLNTLPGDTTAAHAAAAAIVPGGLSGGIINRSRQALRDT